MPAAPDVLTVLVVDDEPVARERMERLLLGTGAAAVRTARDGLAAVEAIALSPPDVVFLDVQMPGLDGFGVVRRVGPERMPTTVFVTAYEEYAARAFEAEALDYLVKPYADERFLASFERVRRRILEGRLSEVGARLHALLSRAADPSGGAGDRPADLDDAEARLEPAAGRLERLVVKGAGRTRLLRAAAVDWIEADGVYARLHAGAESHLVRIAMHELEARLDPRQFVRVHRSAIVNLDRVRELREAGRGEYDVVLESGVRVKMSRSRKTALERRLGQSL